MSTAVPAITIFSKKRKSVSLMFEHNND